MPVRQRHPGSGWGVLLTESGKMWVQKLRKESDWLSVKG